MPIYEYVCTQCGARFEKLILSASRERLVRCPKCDSGEVNKAISLCSASSGGGGAIGGGASNCAPSG